MNSRKVALVVPNNLWFSPYVNIYIELFKQENVEYDIIYWNRSGETTDDAIAYEEPIGRNPVSKLFSYWKFARFVKSQLSVTHYAGVVIFTTQVGLFCASFLKTHYKGRYILDYRDLSIEQKPYFKQALRTLLSNSFANVISSPAFKQCLPDGVKCYISHNFIISEVKKSVKEIPSSTKQGDKINVLTIGSIRKDCNPEIIDALGNKKNILLSFVGRGPASAALEEYAKVNGYQNISFQGYYEKCNEPGIIRNSDFINIYYPNIISHQTALSNRFYNSIIYRVPMIVTKGQIQGYYCEKYNLGLVIENTENLEAKLSNWISQNDFNDYQNRCIVLLKEFIQDYEIFASMVSQFLKQ